MPGSPSSSDPPHDSEGGAEERPAPRRNVLFTIAYLGGAYSGWQIQPVSPTVQGTLERLLEQITGGRRCRIRAAGRTDAGVHAEAQVANLLTDSEVPLRGFIRGLNTKLPADIAIRAIQEAPLAFDARVHNYGKRYCYSIHNRRPPVPVLMATSYHLHRPLALPPMAAAARLLVGTHDFEAFRSANCGRETTVRTVHRCTVSVQEGTGLIQIRVDGTAFLKNMVRIIAGTLIEVGKGVRSVESVGELLLRGDRTQAGFTAPPHGLCLERVFRYFPSADRKW